MNYELLVIDGGGREHALCYASIVQSGDTTCIPGLEITNSEDIISFCRNCCVGLVLPGPKAPLLDCLADDLVKAGIPTFGPSSEAAALQ